MICLSLSSLGFGFFHLITSVSFKFGELDKVKLNTEKLSLHSLPLVEYELEEQS